MRTHNQTTNFGRPLTAYGSRLVPERAHGAYAVEKRIEGEWRVMANGDINSESVRRHP